ncbi:MAG: hypothetical protein AUI36_26610 [Cyanobacteria bacterium 13_1_40CM_2_61_4]|nr:MAG: hypothetical protein AUI36_26610 [Cyanobacteria bacterium 13_1_40CM_2_61_4]
MKRSSVVIPNALSPVKQQIKLRDSTLQRMHQRAEELARGFAAYCDQFDDSNLFTGPSRYFHFKTLTLLRKHKSMAGVMQDEDFFESLYATLTAWGMHRMGDTKTKLVDFPEMVSSFREEASEICKLASFVRSVSINRHLTVSLVCYSARPTYG